MSVTLLPSHSTILEILEDVTPDAELLKACRLLKQYGFRLALDDFTPQGNKRELVSLADFIKVDFRSSTPAIRRDIYDMGRNKNIAFLAEKVETRYELREAQAEGNTYFQGYFNSRPEIITEPQISANKYAYLQIFVALAKPSMDMIEVEHLLMMEPSLCYRLLRLANSALYGLRYRISSIHAALIAVGEDAFRKLVTVVLAGALSKSTPDLVVRQALERANFCESLASMLDENPAELYMLGMLSMMDQMLNVSMKQLLTLVSLTSRIEDALRGSSKGLGRALELCQYYEHAGNDTPTFDSDALLRNSASRYFDALLSTGRALHALGW
jgi:EAL and modified HD-GYP domain-containing signal transduction protein